MPWNKKATAVLVITGTDVKTEASYYGEQMLRFIATNGESAVVQVPKSSPIYDVVWNSSSIVFCAVYGFMSAKATTCNLKCDPFLCLIVELVLIMQPTVTLMDMFVLAGCGNLRGHIEVWGVKNYKHF